MSDEWNAAEYPWQKRFPKDSLAGPSASMTHLQRSIYHTLLDRAWTMNGLPTDHDKLARLAFCSRGELDEAWTWPLDEIFVKSEDGRLRNGEQETLREEAVALREKRVRGGKKAGRGRSARAEQQDSNSSANAQQQECVSSGGGIKQPQSQSQPQSDSSEKRVAAPQAEQTRRPKRANREANMLEACERLDAPPWLAEALGVYMRARKSAKFKVWSAELWEDEAKQILKLGEDAGRRACLRASKKPWSRIVYEDEVSTNARPASSQGPSRGSWYKGAPLKQAEQTLMEADIIDRMKVQVGDYLLSDEDAMRMAREQGDHGAWVLDWKTGRRNDPPPTSPPKQTIDVTPRGVQAWEDTPF